VVLKGEANQIPNEEPGDIIVFIVEQTPEDFPFKRIGKDDLLYKQKISLTEALIGFKFAISHMDNRTLVITSQPGDVIKPGSKKVVLGEGMPIKVGFLLCFFFCGFLFCWLSETVRECLRNVVV
jgi:DnaJ family protein A protein 2